ncbi:DUF1272 domain-containing protein [Shimia sp.]|uniref:DUF1272 domain-containing protein n=1 Tax=Shimia sp. TaxID=1954381 RepID=UPI003BA92B5E
MPPESADARICTYYCDCAKNVLRNVCATCGGNLVLRPVKLRVSYRCELKLALEHQPTSTQRHHSKWSEAEVAALSIRLRNVAPEDQ